MHATLAMSGMFGARVLNSSTNVLGPRHMDILNSMIGCYHMPEEPSLIPIGNPKMFAIGTVPVCNAPTLPCTSAPTKLQPQEPLCCFSSRNQAKTDLSELNNNKRVQLALQKG